MGEHAISKMAKDLSRRLVKDPSNVIAKCMHRLAKTQLSEVGAHVAGLQTAGN